MIKQFINGEWFTCDDEPTDVLGIYRKYNATGGYVTWAPSVIDEATEKSWASSELARTDKLVMLPDYPYTQELFDYRTLLRDYDFSGTRPAIPTTKSGTQL